jgi:hypothetical protein
MPFRSYNQFTTRVLPRIPSTHVKFKLYRIHEWLMPFRSYNQFTTRVLPRILSTHVKFKLYHIYEWPITFRSYNQLTTRITSHTSQILSTHVQFKLYRIHEWPITFPSYNLPTPRVTFHNTWFWARMCSLNFITYTNDQLHSTHISAYIFRHTVRHHAWDFGCIPVGVADPDSHAQNPTNSPFIAKYSNIYIRIYEYTNHMQRVYILKLIPNIQTTKNNGSGQAVRIRNTDRYATKPPHMPPAPHTSTY